MLVALHDDVADPDSNDFAIWPGQASIKGGKTESTPSITVYHPAIPTGTAVVISPGGGGCRAVWPEDKEGKGIAETVVPARVGSCMKNDSVHFDGRSQLALNKTD